MENEELNEILRGTDSTEKKNEVEEIKDCEETAETPTIQKLPSLEKAFNCEKKILAGPIAKRWDLPKKEYEGLR